MSGEVRDDGSKLRVSPIVMLGFGLLAGIVTALLTLVMAVVPAVIIGGAGLGLATRLYLRVRAQRGAAART
jgi:hypothetical protein